MFSRDRWNEILEVLTTNWFRTVLTAFGVFWGILILILLLSAGKGMENGIKGEWGDIATNSLWVWTRNTTLPHKGLPKGRSFEYKLQDVQSLKDKVPNLRIISPRNSLGGYRGANNVIRGLRTGAFGVYGDFPSFIDQEPMDIINGRFINQSDINDKRKVAIIGEGVKKSLYDIGQEVLGTYIKIQGVNFMVVGIYRKKNLDGDGEEAQNQIFIPFTSFGQAFNTGDDVGSMMITAIDGVSITSLKDRIIKVLKEKHKIHPDDRRAIGNFDMYEEFSRIERFFVALNIMGYFIGILVLLSGIIGVSNIMLIVIKERTKEIGIRRALGEDPWSIRKQILLESVFLTIISGMMGIIIGAFAIYGINALLDANGPVDMFVNPTVSLGVVTIALVILIISGLLAGFIPAQSAIRIKPIDALRTE